MYTAYGTDAKPVPSSLEPSALTPAVPKSPALAVQHMANKELQPPRRAPTSSPSVTPVHSGVTSPPVGGAAGQSFHDGMKDLHLSGSEPRIYPGMISSSRRQRANSLRQGVAQEPDVAAGKKGAPGGMDGVGETDETKE